MKLKLNILFFLLINSFIGQAQDIHFSQIFNSPLNLNPALTGSYDTDFRMVLNHRNQWNSFTNAYNTMSASFEFKKKVSISFIDKLSSGLLINNDRAGDGNLTKTGIYLPVAASTLQLNDNLIISLGVMAGFNQLSIDFSQFYFGTQFDGNMYDPSLPNYETFKRDKFIYFDWGSGVNLSYKYNNINISSGFSVNHINQPHISFLFSPSLMRSIQTSYVTINIISSPVYNVSFSYINKIQGRYNEDLFGSMITVKNSNIYFHSFSGGLFYRNKDAIILMSYLNINNIQIGLSYDINISKLSNASQGRGGFEFSLIYLFNINKPSFYYPPKPCPDFI